MNDRKKERKTIHGKRKSNCLNNCCDAFKSKQLQSVNLVNTPLPWIFFLLLKQLHWRSSIFALRKCLKSPARCFKHYKTSINRSKNFPSAVGGKDVNPASSSSRALAPWWALIKHDGFSQPAWKVAVGIGEVEEELRRHRLRFHWLHTSDGAIRFPRLPVNI